MSQNDNPKFNFKEIVRIIKQSESEDNVIDLEGYVSGRAQDEKGAWSYAVFLYDLDENWSFDEDMLQTTGKTHESLSETLSIHIRMEGRRGIVVLPDNHLHE